MKMHCLEIKTPPFVITSVMMKVVIFNSSALVGCTAQLQICTQTNTLSHQHDDYGHIHLHLLGALCTLANTQHVVNNDVIATRWVGS